MPAIRSTFPTTPISTPADSSAAWQELEEVLAELGRLARTPLAANEFHRRLLDQTVGALVAVGGAVWLRGRDGAMQRVADSSWPATEFDADSAGRRVHEALLADAAIQGRTMWVPPGTTPQDGHDSKLAGCLLLVVPVQVQLEVESDQPAADDRKGEASEQGIAATVAIIEILMRPDASPNVYRGAEQFLEAVCDVAADHYAFHELRRLRREEGYYEQLLRFGRQAHAQLDLMETAYVVANDGRRVVGCDRLSVLSATPARRCRLLATSGVGRVERRTTAARQLEELAELVLRTNEPAYYADGQSDALPPVAEALERHAEASHARQVAAIPLRHAVQIGDKEQSDQNSVSRRASSTGPTFVLIGEQFDARIGDLHRHRLAEVGEVCGTALASALELHQMPLGWLLRPLGHVKRRAVAHWPRYAVALAAITVAVAALFVVPADFNIEAAGTLQPVVRRDVFAPRSGLVDEVLVSHGDDVDAGQALARLRDPALDLELKRVHGELETALRQLDAIKATKTSRAVRDANPTETYRLSAEEREIEQRVTNLRRELELLTSERDKLVVKSPIAGRVLTWDIAHRLTARPVERGAVLVTVADLSAGWKLELDVPDDRIGHVLAAQQELQPELPVRFRLSSDDGQPATSSGHVTQVSQTADLGGGQGASPSPQFRVDVAFNAGDLNDEIQRELRPGVSARAQIECGRRSLGYVWLHDIWDAVTGWLRF